ncbi:MAG: hypothetical protein M3Y82_08580 [Verrucomicrobiota bacterium]|nr:hypothetical protein [Verrucomicrobiota bacterium]
MATVAAAPVSLGLFSGPKPTAISFAKLRFATLAELVGTKFDVCQISGTTKLEMIEASASPDHGLGGKVIRKGEPETFSLMFRGSKDQPLQQSSYQFEHPKIGRFVMFIVPVGDAAALTGSRYYQAVFNRPAQSAT